MKTIKFVYLIILFLLFSQTTWSQSQTNSNAEQILQEVIASANKVPLDELLQNPTFAANFQDAQNLEGKTVELTEGGKELDDNGVIMAKMEEYSRFKEYTSTVNYQTMRNELTAINRDISYRDPDKTTNEFVVAEYVRMMMQMEKDMQTKKELSPSYRNIQEVAVEDL